MRWMSGPLGPQPGPLFAALGIALSAMLAAGPQAMAQSLEIAIVVNDEPISAWDIDQRVKFYQATGAKGDITALKARSTKELVDELLMRQAARRAGIAVNPDVVRAQIDARLRPLKRTYAQFKQYLQGRGVRMETLENQLSAMEGWRDVIRRNYGSLVSISESDVDAAAGELAVPEDEQSGSEILVLQRIVLALPDGADDALLARRMTEAEKIRSGFRSCARSKAALKRYEDVSITDIPKATPADLEEPTRSLVLQAAAGEVTPPNPTPEGIELIAVCDRRADGGRRRTARRQLLSQELSMLSDRHLRDLRQDAVIDYR